MSATSVTTGVHLKTAQSTSSKHNLSNFIDNILQYYVQ